MRSTLLRSFLFIITLQSNYSEDVLHVFTYQKFPKFKRTITFKVIPEILPFFAESKLNPEQAREAAKELERLVLSGGKAKENHTNKYFTSPFKEFETHFVVLSKNSKKGIAYIIFKEPKFFREVTETKGQGTMVRLNSETRDAIFDSIEWYAVESNGVIDKEVVFHKTNLFDNISRPFVYFEITNNKDNNL